MGRGKGEGGRGKREGGREKREGWKVGRLEGWKVGMCNGEGWNVQWESLIVPPFRSNFSPCPLSAFSLNVQGRTLHSITASWGKCAMGKEGKGREGKEWERVMVVS